MEQQRWLSECADAQADLRHVVRERQKQIFTRRGPFVKSIYSMTKELLFYFFFILHHNIHCFEKKIQLVYVFIWCLSFYSASYKCSRWSRIVFLPGVRSFSSEFGERTGITLVQQVRSSEKERV